MNRLGKTFTMFCTPLLAVAAAANTSQNDEDFLSKVKSSIQRYGNHADSQDTYEHIMFRIVGARMGQEEFCDTYHSLHGKSVADEMISVITIRNFYVNASHNSKEYTKKVIKAIQAHVNRNENHIFLNGLGLTIDYTRQRFLRAFDVSNSTTEKVYGEFKKFNMLVIKNFSQICVNALKNALSAMIVERLYDIVDLDLPTKCRNKCMMDPFVECTYENIISQFKDLVYTKQIHQKIVWDIGGTNAAFELVYEEMSKQGIVLGFDNYQFEKDEILQLYDHCILVKHKEVFAKGINDLASEYLSHFEAEHSKKVFTQSLELIVRNVYEYVIKNKLYLTNSSGNAWCIDMLCKEKSFLDLVEKYFYSMHSDEIEKLYHKTCENLIETICQEIRSEYITRIFYTGKIDSGSINKVCGVIAEQNVFEELFPFQSVFIDDKRLITKDRAEERMDVLNTIQFDSDATTQFVEISSMIKPTAQDTGCSGLMNFRLKRVLSENVENVTSVYTETRQELIKKMFTISKYDQELIDTTREDIKRAKQLCMSINMSQHVDTHVVSIYNELGSIFIYLFRHKRNDSEEKMISLIYDTPVTKTSVGDNSLEQTFRCVRCLDDASDLILENFLSYLQHMQLTKSIQLTIPNVYLMGDFECIFVESIISQDKFCRSYDKMVFKTNQWGLRSGFVPMVRIYSEQILSFNFEQKYNCKKLSEFIGFLGIEEASFNQIMHEFILNRRAIEFAGFDPNTMDKYDMARGFDLYVTSNDKVNKVLHIIEVVENYGYQYITVNPAKLLAKILEFQEAYNLFDALDSALQEIKYPKTAFNILSDEICRELKYFIADKSWENSNEGKRKCLHIIYECQRKIFQILRSFYETNAASAVQTSNCNDTQTQKMIKSEETEKFAEDIFYELVKLSERVKTKVISIRIKNKMEYCNIKKEDLEERRNYEQYEHVNDWLYFQ